MRLSFLELPADERRLYIEQAAASNGEISSSRGINLFPRSTGSNTGSVHTSLRCPVPLRHPVLQMLHPALLHDAHPRAEVE